MIDAFISGAIMLGSAAVGLIFLRSWNRTADRLFLLFALPCFVFVRERGNPAPRPVLTWSAIRSSTADTLVATVMFPDLGAKFPQLAKPTEGAFVAVAMKVMPIGLLGLLMCAMFGATLTNMDAAVNKYVGVFVRSFYRPILRPDASEKSLLIVSKVCTLVFGALIITLAVVVRGSAKGSTRPSL